MNNKVTRTVLLLGVAIILYIIVLVFGSPANAKWTDILRGASAGIALAGTISFLILLADQIKLRRQ